jgi:hypothetical protein
VTERAGATAGTTATATTATTGTATAGGDGALWVGLAAAAGLLAAAAVLVAPPLSHVLFPPVDFHFFPVWQGLVHPKPVEETRYLMAVALTIAAAIGLARAPVVRVPGRLDGRRAAHLVRLASAAAKLASAGLAVWCFRRYETADDRVGVGHFRLADVAAGAVVALLVAGLVWLRPRSVGGGRPAESRSPAIRLVWPSLAALATGCWLLPAIFRNRNIGHALFVMWWHLQFVYGDFVATLGGRTPLIDYNAEYGSLLPVALEPALRVFGPSVGSFTVLMCLLTLAALLAVERALALVAGSERLALGLYLPFLAAGFFTEYQGGTERFYFGNYFAVFPLRYLGPYVLLWLCVRHLRGRRPQSAVWIFAVGGLATLNDVEFGLPALVAAAIALAAAAPRDRPVRAWLAPLARAAAVGVIGALVAVIVVLWLRTGRLIELGRLTRYAQLFGRAGFGEVPTPTIGLHLVIYATFVGSLATAAVRHRRDAADRALTGALAFAGVFGLGAGSYYMGGSNPSQLIGVFSAWALAAVLLGLLAVRALAAWRLGEAATRPPVFAVAAALLVVGVLATGLRQFPAPWTQLRRIDGRAATQPYDRRAASAFVRRTAAPGEHVVVLEGLGPLIALDAGVDNVSPYSEVWAVWSEEQLAEITGALRRAHGTRFYLGRAGTAPGIGTALRAAGLQPVAYDAPSQLTEWRRVGA